MRSSYTLRLVVAFAVVGVAAAALTAVLVNLAFGGLLSGYYDQQQAALQRQVVDSLAGSYRAHGAWDPADVATVGGSVAMSGGALQVLDATGATIWAGGQPPRAGTCRCGPGMGGSRGTMGMGRPAPSQRLPVMVDGSQMGTAVLALPPAGLAPPDRQFRDSVDRMLLLGGLVAALVAVGLGVLLARRATVPVRLLTAATEAWRRGDRGRRVGHRSADEFGAMATSFDRMADAIAEQERLRRTFAGDVAHELRTPLMILRGQVEAMQDGVLPPDRAGLASLRDEVLRLSRLAADLEVLAASDAARFSLEQRPVDLAALASEAVPELGALFPDRHLTLVGATRPLWVTGDPVRLRQVLANLVTNALQFTATGERVEVGLRHDGPSGVVEVTDSGPGIPDEELPRVFDRFFRGRRAQSGGSGIGLAVVRELVQAHGGHVTATNALGRGARFRVVLPLAEAAPGDHQSASLRPEPEQLRTPIEGEEQRHDGDERRPDRAAVHTFFTGAGLA